MNPIGASPPSSRCAGLWLRVVAGVALVVGILVPGGVHAVLDCIPALNRAGYRVARAVSRETQRCLALGEDVLGDLATLEFAPASTTVAAQCRKNVGRTTLALTRTRINHFGRCMRAGLKSGAVDDHVAERHGADGHGRGRGPSSHLGALRGPFRLDSPSGLT